MERFILTTVVCLMSCLGYSQQSSCYENTRALGINSYESGDYTKAISAFFVAFDCLDLPADNDLVGWVKKAQQQQVGDLEDLLEKARQAENRAVNSEKQAVELARLADEARRDAERAKNEAIILGKRTETFRMIQLADELRKQGNLTDAFSLVLLGLRLSDSTNYRRAFLAFSDVVRDSFSQALPYTPPLRGLSKAQQQFLVIDQKGISVFQDDSSELLRFIQAVNKPYFFNDNQLVVSVNEPNEGFYYPLLASTDTKYKLMHEDRITNCVINDDYLFSAARDDRVNVWSKESGEFEYMLSGHTGNVYQMLLADQLQMLITRSSDATVRLWDLNSNRPVSKLIQPPCAYIYDMDLSADEEQLVMGLSNGQLMHYTLGTEEVDTITFSDLPIVQVGWLAEEKRAYALSKKGELFLWLKEIPPLRLAENIQGLKLLSEQKELVAWDKAGRIYLWDSNGQLLHLFYPHNAPVIGVDYAPETDCFLSTTASGQIMLWDRSGQIVFRTNKNNDLVSQPALLLNGGRSILFPTEGQVLHYCPEPYSILKDIDLESYRPDTSLSQKYALLYEEYYSD